MNCQSLRRYSSSLWINKNKMQSFWMQPWQHPSTFLNRNIKKFNFAFTNFFLMNGMHLLDSVLNMLMMPINRCWKLIPAIFMCFSRFCIKLLISLSIWIDVVACGIFECKPFKKYFFRISLPQFIGYRKIFEQILRIKTFYFQTCHSPTHPVIWLWNIKTFHKTYV